MCGIAGVVSFDGASFAASEAYLRALRDAMAHRGPDGAGAWVGQEGQVGLAHRRLSIIDLSEAAAQPMANEDGSLRIVFNGEIYNHAGLRRELERTGRHRWATDHSDTEVILHAYEEWGIECLHRFRGMFAFALWDGRERCLWLVRDRMGVKPLYYAVHHGRLVFASEIKALLRDPDQPRAMDEESLFHYLSFLCVPAPRTLFAGVRKLAAGTRVRVDLSGEVREERWYEPWEHVRPLRGIGEGEAAEAVLAELRTAVRLRKVSDVPVGVFLSGGIDSSTNTALFAEGEARPVETFSVGYEGEYETYRDELAFARLMAARVGANHHEQVLHEQELIDFLPRMVHLQDEPIGDPVCFPIHALSALARANGVTVCQVGEGADELFWGYDAWHRAARHQRWAGLPVPRVVHGAALAGLAAVGRERSAWAERVRRAGAGRPLFWGGAEAFTEAHKRRLLAPAARRRLAGATSWEVIEPVRRRFDEGAWEPSEMNWMSFLDLNLRLPELLLMRVDKMSMGVSLEGRVPFLDHALVELALSIPTAVKLGDGTPKTLLKRAVRGVIPDELIDRPKQGFNVPVHEWLMRGLGATARRELDRFCRDTGVLDAGEVRRLFDERRGAQVWYLLNLALWHRAYIEGAVPAEAVPAHGVAA